MVTKNIVPRATGEGAIGTTSKHWGKVWTDAVSIGASGTLTNDTKSATIGQLITANTASEISAVTPKTTLDAGDFLLIEDSAAANIKKNVTIANFDASPIAAVMRPDANNTRDLGLTGTRFKDGYFAGQMNAIRYQSVGEASDPSLTDGLRWYRTDLGKYRLRCLGLTGDIPHNVVVINADTSVNAQASVTAFTGCTVTVPANYMQAAKCIRARLYGYHSSSSSPTTVRLTVRWGGTGGTVLLDSGIITTIASQVTAHFFWDIILTWRSTTTCYPQGNITFNPAVVGTIPARTYTMNSGASAATTVAQAAVITGLAVTQQDLAFCAIFSATTAGNLVTITNGTVEFL